MADALNTALSWSYAATLGVPGNLIAPVKNMTSQSPMIIAGVGTETYLEGMSELGNPDMVEEIHGYNIRPEFALWDAPHAGIRAQLGIGPRALLSLYRASDIVNVYAAASSAIVAWRRIEGLIDENGKLKPGASDGDVIGNLWRGERNRDISDQKVMENPVPSDLWNGVISKPMTLEVIEKLKAGNAAEAKRMFVQYMVNFSQWRYGPGGTPGVLRNAVARNLFMFMSWSINYGDFLGKTYGQGMKQMFTGQVPLTFKGMQGSLLFRSLQMATSQFLIMSVLAKLGYRNVHRWILFGPLPDEIATVGPHAQVLNMFVRLVTGGADALAAYILPIPDEDKKKAYHGLERQWKDWEDMFDPPDWAR